MALTDTQVRKAKVLDKDYQLADSEGLHLLIRANGAKTWRYEFRIEGRKTKYIYGNYPEISLENPRKIHALARQLVAMGRHPATVLDEPIAIQMIIDGHSLKEIEAQAAKDKQQRKDNALPTFGDAADYYNTEWVDTHWKASDKGCTPVRRHLLPKLADTFAGY